MPKEPGGPNGEEKKDGKDKGEAGLGGRLLKARTVLIVGEINQKLAQAVIGQLVVLDQESSDPITIFINSQGGHVESGDTIYDMIKFVRSPVRVVGTGWVASAGITIFLGAKRENRFSLPNTRFLIHQPSGGSFGTAADIQIEAEEIVKMRQRINEIIARETGQEVKRVEVDTDRNFWMSADEAKAYGIVGKIVANRREIE